MDDIRLFGVRRSITSIANRHRIGDAGAQDSVLGGLLGGQNAGHENDTELMRSSYDAAQVLVGFSASFETWLAGSKCRQKLLMLFSRPRTGVIGACVVGGSAECDD
jgi:hypothetical protein